MPILDQLDRPKLVACNEQKFSMIDNTRIRRREHIYTQRPEFPDRRVNRRHVPMEASRDSSLQHLALLAIWPACSRVAAASERS